MITNLRYRAAAVAACMPLFAATAQAADSPWSGNASVGFVSSAGNTQSRSQNAEYGVRYGAAESLWVLSSADKLVQARSRVVTELADGTETEETQTTAENYRANLRIERKLDEKNYFYGNADYVKDLFGSVRTSTSQTLGYGRRLIARETLSLDVELGGGARQEEAQETRETVNEGIGQFGLRFAKKWGDRAQFSELISVQYGEQNTVTDAQTRLKLAVVGSVWAQLGFDLRNNSHTGSDEVSTDTTTSISVLWEFGK